MVGGRVWQRDLRLRLTIGRLGWDAYLVEGPQAQDRNDVRYGIHIA